MTLKPQCHIISRISQGHSVYKVCTLWDLSFLSYAPDKQTNRQTNKQTDSDILPTRGQLAENCNISLCGLFFCSFLNRHCVDSSICGKCHEAFASPTYCIVFLFILSRNCRLSSASPYIVMATWEPAVWLHQSHYYRCAMEVTWRAWWVVEVCGSSKFYPLSGRDFHYRYITI